MSSLPTVIAAGLVRVVWSSLAASMIVTLTFSLAIAGLIRLGDARSAGRSRAVAAYTALALLSSAAFVGFVIYALVLVSQKS